MRAVWITRHGDPSVLEVREDADPVPSAAELRIRVRAAGVNFADLMARLGLYPEAPPPPCVIGYEVAGVVDGVGADVTGFAPGDRVLAFTRFGGYTDVLCLRPEMARRIPDALSFEEAAALPVNGVTAHHVLFHVAHLRHGMRVLVHMAAGGVGTLALQLLATVPGVEVFGTASARKHVLLRELGCHHTLDYHTQDYAAEVRRITGGRGVHLILDPLGGANWRKSYALLAPGGQVVYFGVANIAATPRRRLWRVLGQLARTPFYNPMRLMNDNKTLSGVHIGRMWSEVGLLGQSLDALVALCSAGTLRPRVDATFPLEQAARAHAYLHERRNTGKVVLVP